MKISTILDKINDNQLFVPAFQREYVWKRENAKELIDSLIKEYPTGTMLTWETSKPPELKGPHKYHEQQGAVRILLDGQQRITTLYMLIVGSIPPYYTAEEILEDTRNLYVNLETLELLYYSAQRMQNNPLWQNITQVFQKAVDAFGLNEKVAVQGKAFTTEELKKINDNINAILAIRDRDFPEQTIPIRAKVREAIDIFYKVNASGVSLTDAELALAQISGYWPQARSLFKAKLAALEKEGFSFRLDFIVYVLLGCMYHIGSDMRKLHGEENDAGIRKVWERLDTQILDYVVNLMRSRAFVDHTDEISSIYALVPIIVYCFHQGSHLNDEQIRKLVKWFYYSQVRARYVGQLQQKLDRDLRTIKESAKPFDELLNMIQEESRLEIRPGEFEGAGIQNPLFSMTRWFLKSRGAVCLTTGLPLRKNMGAKYRLENDHIFPFSKLREAGYGKENRFKYSLAQELTNRAILTQVANRTKSASAAAGYLAQVSERFPEALALQCIPASPALWEIDKYEEFLQARRIMLAEGINAFLDGITATAAAEAAASIEDLIAEGESAELEFKSTLRWDIKEGKVNSKLEDVVAKTVAAFANSSGGTLLLGVDNHGAVLGLASDYASLGAADRDKFELHLRALLSQQFGAPFVSLAVRVEFHTVEDKELCEVEVAPAEKPVIVTVSGKDGQKIQRFYVRNGNASQEIALEEMHEYCKMRFGS